MGHIHNISKHGGNSAEPLNLQTIREEAGFLLNLLQERDVVDVVVNPDGRVWANRTGSGFTEAGMFDEVRRSRLLLEIASLKGVEFNAQSPILETDFPIDGSRIEGICAPVVRGIALALRTKPKRIYTLEDYVSAGIITKSNDPLNSKRKEDKFLESVRGRDHDEILRLAIHHYRNILVVGSTGSGKSTFLNMLLDLLRRMQPNGRVITIEDTLELQCSVPNHVSLFTTSDVSMGKCLKASLRLKPHRIIVGEVRDAAAEDMLNAWNTGHPGGFATIHADDALSGLYRIEEMLAMPKAGGMVVQRSLGVRSMIARAVNLVAFIDEEDELTAGRKLREILVVKGYKAEKDEYDYEYV